MAHRMYVHGYSAVLLWLPQYQHDTVKDVSQSALDKLQVETIGPRDSDWRQWPRPISRDAALKLLEEPIRDPEEITGACLRLQNAPRLREGENLDLGIKMFNDLDKVLFHGHLRRRVFIRWTSHHGGKRSWQVYDMGATFPTGSRRDKHQKRVTILLNSTQP